MGIVATNGEDLWSFSVQDLSSGSSTSLSLGQKGQNFYYYRATRQLSKIRSIEDQSSMMPDERLQLSEAEAQSIKLSGRKTVILADIS